MIVYLTVLVIVSKQSIPNRYPMFDKDIIKVVIYSSYIDVVKYSTISNTFTIDFD